VTTSASSRAQALADQAGQLGAFALAAGLEFLQTLGEQGEGFGVEGLRVAGVGHQHAGPGQHLQAGSARPAA